MDGVIDLDALGGIVTKIAFPELYLALAQGVVARRSRTDGIVSSAVETAYGAQFSRRMFSGFTKIIERKS